MLPRVDAAGAQPAHLLAHPLANSAGPQGPASALCGRRGPDRARGRRRCPRPSLAMEVTVIDACAAHQRRGAATRGPAALILAEHQYIMVEFELVGRRSSRRRLHYERQHRAGDQRGRSHGGRSRRGRHRREAERRAGGRRGPQGRGRHRGRRAVPHLRSGHLRGRRPGTQFPPTARDGAAGELAARAGSRRGGGTQRRRGRQTATTRCRRSGPSNTISTSRASAGPMWRRIACAPAAAGALRAGDGVVDGTISAALGINVQRDLAAICRLVERKIPVDPAALADPAQPFNAMLKAKA